MEWRLLPWSMTLNWNYSTLPRETHSAARDGMWLWFSERRTTQPDTMRAAATATSQLNWQRGRRGECWKRYKNSLSFRNYFFVNRLNSLRVTRLWRNLLLLTGHLISENNIFPSPLLCGGEFLADICAPCKWSAKGRELSNKTKFKVHWPGWDVKVGQAGTQTHTLDELWCDDPRSWPGDCDEYNLKCVFMPFPRIISFVMGLGRSLSLKLNSLAYKESSCN